MIGTYSSDWVTANVKLWSRILAEFKGKDGVRALEVGVYEGRSSEWFLSNILTGRESFLLAVDACNWSKDNGELFREAGYDFRFHQGRFFDLQNLIKKEAPYDFIYCDAGKESAAVLETLVLAFSLLKVGGVLIIDDYGWEWNKKSTMNRGPLHPPKKGINAFLSGYQDLYTRLHHGWQVVIRKTADYRQFQLFLRDR